MSGGFVSTPRRVRQPEIGTEMVGDMTFRAVVGLRAVMPLIESTVYDNGNNFRYMQRYFNTIFNVHNASEMIYNHNYLNINDVPFRLRLRDGNLDRSKRNNIIWEASSFYGHDVTTSCFLNTKASVPFH